MIYLEKHHPYSWLYKIKFWSCNFHQTTPLIWLLQTLKSSLYLWLKALGYGRGNVAAQLTRLPVYRINLLRYMQWVISLMKTAKVTVLQFVHRFRMHKLTFSSENGNRKDRAKVKCKLFIHWCIFRLKIFILLFIFISQHFNAHMNLSPKCIFQFYSNSVQFSRTGSIGMFLKTEIIN